MSARPANPELRDKILKAASEIIESSGPDCVTMREVAQKVGYSPTTLYIYFKDKNAVLQEVVMTSFDDLNDSCQRVMVGPRAIDKFRQYCRAYVTWGVMHPGHYTLMFQVPWDMEWAADWAEKNMVRLVRGRTMVLQLLVEAIEGGELGDPGDIQAFNEAGWAALHGSVSLAISRRLTVDLTDPGPAQISSAAVRTADTLVNCLIAGCSAAKSGNPSR